ncbi:MAG: DUF4912 domain-containing protein [Planctomycetota bacterium]
MNANTLRTYTCKDLAQMARSEGVPGWHSMRKDELVAALVRVSKRRGAKSSRNGRTKAKPSASNGRADRAKSAARATKKAVNGTPRRPNRQLEEFRERQAEMKDLGSGGNSAERDRLVVMVRDPYWLHAYWEISPQSVARGRSALGQHWHSSRPVLRVFRVDGDDGAKLERIVEVHGGVSNWYVDVHEPPNSYRLEIGYQSTGGDFYCLARSNTVTTPAPGSADTVDRNWADVAENADQIFAMSGGYSPDGASLELQELLEERLRRRLGRPAQIRFGQGASQSGRNGELRLAIDAELVVYGSTDPHTHVTVKGEPVPVRPDGTFAVKMHLPDRRQVVPVVAGSGDGVEQKTVILGVERNTKMLDPVVREASS